MQEIALLSILLENSRDSGPVQVMNKLLTEGHNSPAYLVVQINQRIVHLTESIRTSVPLPN